MRQNCASGLPNPARLALHLLFACVRGRLNEFAAEILEPLRKSNELENGKLNIDESAPERFCDEFRSGVKSSCASNLNRAAAKLVGGKRDRKLTPKQRCEEFRAGVNGGCAPNLNPCAEYAGAHSS